MFSFKIGLAYYRWLHDAAWLWQAREDAEAEQFVSELQRDEMGRRVNEEKWLERLERRERLEQQTAEIASKLLTVGLDLRAPPTDEPVFQLGALTPHIVLADAQRYKKSMFLPSIAKVLRSSNSLKLEAYLREHKRGKYARYMVLTNGGRVAWSDPDFRQKIADFHSRIAYMVREMKRVWGVEVVVRATEETLREHALPAFDGVHLHANLVYIPPHFGKGKFGSFLSWLKKQNDGFGIKDCGRIKNVNEICKYVTKPAVSDKERAEVPGLVGTSDIRPERILWLHNAARLMHFWQPYHAFRDWCADLNLTRRRLYRTRGTGEIVKVPKLRVERRPAEDVSRENIWIGTTLPATRFGPIVEPVLLVLNWTDEPASASGKARLKRIKEFRYKCRQWALDAAFEGYKEPEPKAPPIRSTTGQQLDKIGVPDWVSYMIADASGPPLECVTGPS